MGQVSLVFLRPFSYIALSRAQEQTATFPHLKPSRPKIFLVKAERNKKMRGTLVFLF